MVLKMYYKLSFTDYINMFSDINSRKYKKRYVLNDSEKGLLLP